MKIKKLTLSAGDIVALQNFYGNLFGFSARKSDANHLVLSTGDTDLIFVQRETHPVYHFAFLIPTGSLEAAIGFVESRGIELLPLNDEKVIHFDSGRSIYFYDPDGNIAEFIERPRLSYPPKISFEISDVIRLNEIGLPVKDPIQQSHEIIKQFGIHPLNKDAFRENFCWVGDHEGALIVVAKGRHWLPTDVPSQINDFDIEYLENNKSYHLKCDAGNLSIC